jgi:hypothetical protein
VLTKDNLLRGGWTGDPQCHFCSKHENIDHLLFSCALAKLIWQVILCAFHLVRPPEDTADMFGELIKSFPKSRDIWLCVAHRLSVGCFGRPEMMRASTGLVLVTELM